MDKVQKYMNEESKEKEALSMMNNVEYSTLKRAYYGVADNIEQLGKSLNSLNGETGLFGKELKAIVKARDAFRKIDLFKYGV